MKDLLIGVVIGGGIAILFVFWLCCKTEKMEIRKDAAFQELNINEENNTDTIAEYQWMDGTTGLVDELMMPYMIKELCGYALNNQDIGVITVSKDITQKIYNRAFPTVIKNGEKDSIPNCYIMVAPNNCFPQGECGKILHIFTTDEFYQVQFLRTDIQEAMVGLDKKMEKVMNDFREIEKQLNDIK